MDPEVDIAKIKALRKANRHVPLPTEEELFDQLHLDPTTNFNNANTYYKTKGQYGRRPEQHYFPFKVYMSWIGDGGDFTEGGNPGPHGYQDGQLWVELHNDKAKERKRALDRLQHY